MVFEDLLPKLWIVEEEVFLVVLIKFYRPLGEAVGSVHKGVVGNSGIKNQFINVLLLLFFIVSIKETQDSFLKQKLNFLWL